MGLKSNKILQGSLLSGFEGISDNLKNLLYYAAVSKKSRRWRYNTIRPYSSLNYRPPTPEAILFSGF